jgi:hypothetical protein
VIRREELTGGLDLGPDPDLRAVIRDRYGLAPSWSGCYRRVHYNVLLESLRSGHAFSVMFDRCTDAAGLAPDLHQAEVEYIRSCPVADKSALSHLERPIRAGVSVWTARRGSVGRASAP